MFWTGHSSGKGKGNLIREISIAASVTRSWGRLARTRDRGLVEEEGKNEIRGDERARVDVSQEEEGGEDAGWRDDHAGAEDHHGLQEGMPPVSRGAASSMQGMFTGREK